MSAPRIVLPREIVEASDPALVDELLLGLAEKNSVRATLHRRSRRARSPYPVLRKVADEMGSSLLHPSALIRLDELRALAGLPTRYLEKLAAELDWELAFGLNVRTTVGIDYVADSLGNSGSRPAVANFMAVSEDATAPAVGNTVVAGEITSGTDSGLARATATYAHSAGVASYTLQKVFTAAATHTAVQKDGIFNASSAGTLFVSATFTAAAMQISDQLTVTHTLNI